jgi:hypothetical protein
MPSPKKKARNEETVKGVPGDRAGRLTRITHVAEKYKDYWAERGYSCYDGI